GRTQVGVGDSSPAPGGTSQLQLYLGLVPVPNTSTRAGRHSAASSHSTCNTHFQTREETSTIVACFGTPKTTPNSALRGPSPKAAGPRPGSGAGGLGDRRSDPGGEGGARYPLYPLL